VPLTADFELDEAAMLAAIERHRPAMTYIAYPNNPTGQPVRRRGDRPHRRGRRRAARPGGLRRGLPAVLVAHLDAAHGAHEHVLVMRTLSKFGLAGVRLGYLCGAAALIDEVDKVRPPYNVSVLNAEAALFALEHADEYARQAALLRASASGCSGAARAARRAALPQRGQHGAGARARLAARLRRHEERGACWSSTSPACTRCWPTACA
jgi:histidinol-phosphate aminotransferase